NYQWTVIGGTITSVQGTGTITVDLPAGSTNATVQVSDVNSAGCGATFTVRPDNASVALQAASVVAGDRSITLQLNVPNNAGNASQVRILRRVAGSGTFAQVGTVANTATSFTDSNVDADANAYDYRLELQNSCGTVLQTQDHTTIRTTATATEGQEGRDEGKVKVSWNAYRGFDVKEYRIFRTSDNGTSTLVATVSGGTLQTEFASSTAGFDQCLRVVAVSSANASVTSASNDACVSFANDLVFYNVITPNNDGLNDKFEIKNVGLYPGNSLTILNRWGKEVYRASNYNNQWDGAEQAAGVYYYLLKLPGGKSYKGWFEVVK
ncbi:T9SS type B sorting domain-containing protein, partial [Hymenobacter persicinus]